MKVSTIDRHRFNPDLLVSLAGSEGRAPTPADFSPLKGIFQPQKPFDDSTVFEGFDALARTPEGEPFFGGTYFPKATRYGLPGFTDLLKRVDHALRMLIGEYLKEKSEALRIQNSRGSAGAGTT